RTLHAGRTHRPNRPAVCSPECHRSSRVGTTRTWAPNSPVDLVTCAPFDTDVRRVHTLSVGGVERLPRRDHFTDERGHGLRATWHPDQGLVILSIWDGERCVGTFRLSQDDVPRLASFLVAAFGGAAHSGPPLASRGDTAVNGD